MAFEKHIVLLTVSAFLLSPLQALEIPLSGVTDSSGKGGASLGYVDMDRIFEIYPQTQAAKEDYTKQLKKKKEQLSAKEAELADVQNRMSVLEATMKQTVASDPTAQTLPDGSAPGSEGLAKMKVELEERKAELDELRKQATADLATFQSKQSEIILGKIYQALKDVATEEQVSVVVDKASILYGDAAIDLTEKLQERVRGY